MTRMVRSRLAILALAAMLSACHAQPKAGHGEVSGQILPGSISDAMLPYDAVKSKAPLAPQDIENRSNKADDDNAADSTDAAADSASALPDVPATPTPAAPLN